MFTDGPSLPLRKIILFIAATLAVAMEPAASDSNEAGAASAKALGPVTLVGTQDFTVDTSDVEKYLNYLAFSQGNASPQVNQQRVSQAIIELYAIKTLDLDAKASGLVVGEDLNWIANYVISMERIKFYLRNRVEEMLSDTNWEQEAYEYYLAKKEDFAVPASVDIRTLLIKSEGRTLQEAVAMMEDLISPNMSVEAFKSAVEANTEDDAARVDAGLMEGVTLGQTVPPFEKAIFSLTEIGDIAVPVITEFGVHAAQLLDTTPERQKTFAEARKDIVALLRPLRREQYFSQLREEAKSREPDSFKIDEQAISSFMQQFKAD